MFLDIAVAAVGIGVVVMVGYLIVYNVKVALPLSTVDNATSSGIATAQTTIFAGFALVAVGILVIAAFGLLSVFR